MVAPAATAPFALPSIVLVDDCENDLFVSQLLMRRGEIANPIVTFTECQKAMAFLTNLPEAAAVPCAVLTDLKMPVVDGFEFVKWIRGHRRLDRVRVGVVATSNFYQDRQRAVASGAQAYYTKFPTAGSFAEFVRAAMDAGTHRRSLPAVGQTDPSGRPPHRPEVDRSEFPLESGTFVRNRLKAERWGQITGHGMGETLWDVQYATGLRRSMDAKDLEAFEPNAVEREHMIDTTRLIDNLLAREALRRRNA